MKINRFLILGFVLSGIIVYVSCRKLDTRIENVSVNELERKFFKSHPPVEPLVLALNNYLQRENSKYHFVEKVVKQIGFPRWNKALIVYGPGLSHRGATDSANLTYIPFVRDTENFVNACLLIQTTLLDTTYEYLCDWQYAEYGFDTASGIWNARDVFHLFSVLDREVFDRNKFKVIDERLLTAEEISAIDNAGLIFDSIDVHYTFTPSLQGQGRNNVNIEVTFCDDWEVCIQPCYAFKNGNKSASRSTDCCAVWLTGEICTTSWVWIPSGGGGGTGGGGNPPGGGGGNPPGGGGPPECGGGNPQRSNLIDPCGPGWLPIPEPEPGGGGYNPYLADTIGITNRLQNAYPCTYAFIHDSLPNANVKAQLAGSSVFKDSTYMHLTFDTSTNNTGPTDLVATTTSTNLIIDNNGKTHFYAVIKLNGWHLRNSAKEYTFSTILHELMHAVFNLRWGQYQAWLANGQGSIDSAFMKNHFPIYWQNYVINGIPPSQISDHEIMITDYKNYFITSLRPFYNPSASAALRDTVLMSLGYVGLSETTVWKMLSDTCKYKNINYTARQPI